MTEGAPDIEMYATDWCPYCAGARRLLEAKGVAWREIDVDLSPDARAQMRERARRTSVPQIFIDGRHIGGYDDLKALDDAGGLDPLLKNSIRG